ncbi:MAG: response regulator, partial [Acidimicrobiales bacterium]
ERNGHDVVAAGDDESALALSRHHKGRIDLLVTDVVMARMQGTELAGAILAERPGIIVVYMSGYAKEAFGNPAVRPIALIEKPFGEEELLEVLRLHMPD